MVNPVRIKPVEVFDRRSVGAVIARQIVCLVPISPYVHRWGWSRTVDRLSELRWTQPLAARGDLSADRAITDDLSRECGNHVEVFDGTGRVIHLQALHDIALLDRVSFLVGPHQVAMLGGYDFNTRDGNRIPGAFTARYSERDETEAEDRKHSLFHLRAPE